MHVTHSDDNDIEDFSANNISQENEYDMRRDGIMKRVLSSIIITLLLTSMLTLAFNVQITRPELTTKTGSTQAPSQQTIGTADHGMWSAEDKGFRNLNITTRLYPHKDDYWKQFSSCDGESVKLIFGVDIPKTQIQTVKDTISNEGGKVTGTISTSDGVKAVVATVPLSHADTLTEKLRASDLVKYVEPDSEAEAFFTPNDQYWFTQWGPKKIEADWAWNTTTGSSSILVAIVDTGIDYTHSDLAANYVPLGYDWVNDDADPKDDFGHGTHCAGIVAASINNSVGIAGLAQVRIMTEKVLDISGRGYYSWIAQGIIHATDQGAKIISMSLGGTSDSSTLHDAVKYAYDHGVLLVASAGNSATDQKSYPAAYDEVIAVTATDASDSLASFSSFGDWVELAAPGVDIYSTMPTYHVTLNDYGYAMNYDYLSGTSMACPHVTGVAALSWSLFADYTRDQIRRLLQHSANDLGDTGFDVYFGYGRVNAQRALNGLPEHDTSISGWRHPCRVDPGQTAVFNVTVCNSGTKNETDVSVQFFVNETLTDSTTISFFAVDACAEVSFLWNTTTLGDYNVTCYVVPVTGENQTEDNIASADLFVRPPTTLRVPDDFLTIKEAVNRAGDGDTVLVNEGYYDEGQINIFKNNITLAANGNASLNGWRATYVFYVAGDFVTVDGFDIRNSSNYGIRMTGYGNTLTNNHIINSPQPVIISDSIAGNISLNYVVTHSGGIVIQRCSNCTIDQNTLVGNSFDGGLHVWWSSNNTISQNTITGGILDKALDIYFSENNVIASNNVTKNRCGIALCASPNNILRNNRMDENTVNFGVWIEDVLSYPWQTVDDVDASNTVDGKPIYYWVDVHDAAVPSDAGCVVLVYCENIEAENLTLQNNLNSIFVVNSSNIQIRFNNITKNNGFSSVMSAGLLSGGIGALFDCSNITVSQNDMKDNDVTLWLYASNCNVSLNKITNGLYPALMCYGSNNVITLNNVTNIQDRGVIVDGSGCTISFNNIMSNDCSGLIVYGSNHTITSNNIFENARVWKGHSGIILSASNSVISSNKIISTKGPGISVYSGASNNMIFHNTFINNTPQVDNSGFNNTWDDGYPSGGNYWSDYKGLDSYSGPYQNETGSDGIGDTPYVIGVNDIDHYPLMKPSQMQHDIGIVTVKTSKTIIPKGYNMTVTINVTITNYGEQTETFNVTTRVNSAIIQTHVTTLDANDSTTLTFTWNTTGQGYADYAINASAEPVPGEMDTTDNTLVKWITITIPGDVTSQTPGVPDFEVNMRDIGALCNKFNRRPSSPDWDPNMDINDDGVINMRDIGIACNNFMKT